MVLVVVISFFDHIMVLVVVLYYQWIALFGAGLVLLLNVTVPLVIASYYRPQLFLILIDDGLLLRFLWLLHYHFNSSSSLLVVPIDS